MAVHVTRHEAVVRALSAEGKLGLPQAWAPFLSRPINRRDDDPNDCDWFVTWCLKDNGGRQRSDYRNGSIKETRKDRHWDERSTGSRGDLILLRWSAAGLPDHIGMTLGRNKDGSYNTIEANTGPRVGVTNPAGVYKRTRFRQNIVGFIVPPYLNEEK